jgi:hypothetical protein
VKRRRRARIPVNCVHRPKPAGGDIQIPGAVVVEAEGGIELFAGEEVIVGCGASGVDQVAEGVVVVGNY